MALKIAILASGSGSNAQAMIDKARQGILDVDIRLVVSNRPGAGVLERAKKAGIPATLIDHGDFADRAAHEAQLIEKIRQSGAEYVALAGYMRLLTPLFLEAFQGRVLNLHPALLPSFPGTNGGKDALDYGVKLTGCSVHFVEEDMDAGPLIIQAAVPVKAGEELETLMQRIHALEHRIYPQALQWLAEGRISRKGREVYLAPGKGKIQQPDGQWLVWPPLEEGF